MTKTKSVESEMSIKVVETEYERTHWLTNRLSELIPVEDRYKASEILEDHLKHFNILPA